MNSFICRGLGFGLFAALVAFPTAEAQTRMQMLVQGPDGRKPVRSNWLLQKWDDKKTDAALIKIRLELEKLPARNRQVDKSKMHRLIAAARSKFQADPTDTNFFRWLSLCGRYPNTGREDSLPIQRYLFQFQSPKSFEYARAAFIFTAEVLNGMNLPKGYETTFRSRAKNDWLLTEALIKLSLSSRYATEDDLWWGWREAKRLAETMSDGVYGFGRLRLDVSWALMGTDTKFIDQEIAYVDYLIGSNVFSVEDVGKLKRAKASYQKVKQRAEDYRRKHPDGSG